MSTTIPPARIALIDVLRGVALVAMTIYHFAWDLEFFGWTPSGTTFQPGWVLFARSIASSFLFLVGISLVLAHGEGIKWPGFRKRLYQLTAAAAVISVVTWFAVPGGFIFFGILHGIALFSLIGLIFVRLPWFVSAGTAVVVLWIARSTSAEIFQHPLLLWVGLSPVPPVSNDFVPLFPWFAAPLAGIAVAKLLGLARAWERLARINLPAPIQTGFSFIGRHSLVYYLVHQPIMIGLLAGFTALAGPPDQTANFLQQCSLQCTPNRGEAFCSKYCSCIADDLKRAGLFVPFNAGKVDLATNQSAQTIINTCTARFNDQ